MINRIGVYHESAVHLLRKHDSAKSVRESYFPEAQPEPCRVLDARVQSVAAAHNKGKDGIVHLFPMDKRSDFRARHLPSVYIQRDGIALKSGQNLLRFLFQRRVDRRFARIPDVS